MAGEEQHALALRVSGAGAFLAVELDAAAHLVRAERAEPQELEQQPAEVHEHRARDLPSLGGRPLRERGCQIRIGDAAMHPVHGIERQAERRTHRPDDRVWQHPHEAAQGKDRQVLGTVSHALGLSRARASAMRPVSQDAKSVAGSTPTFSGSTATRNGHGRWISSRIRSFSVVMTISAAVSRSLRRNPIDVGARKRVVIAERHGTRDVQALGANVRFEPGRTGDAADEQRSCNRLQRGRARCQFSSTGAPVVRVSGERIGDAQPVGNRSRLATLARDEDRMGVARG